MNKFLLSDSDGSKSVTVTAFILGFLVVNLKLIISGMVIYGVNCGTFTGSEYSMAVAALGAVYVLRRNARDKTE